MNLPLRNIVEYTDDVQTLRLVSQYWNRDIELNDIEIMEGLQRLYPDALGIQGILRYAIESNDVNTARLITTVYTGQLYVYWPFMATLITNRVIARYVLPRLDEFFGTGLDIHWRLSMSHRERARIFLLDLQTLIEDEGLLRDSTYITILLEHIDELGYVYNNDYSFYDSVIQMAEEPIGDTISMEHPTPGYLQMLVTHDLYDPIKLLETKPYIDDDISLIPWDIIDEHDEEPSDYRDVFINMINMDSFDMYTMLREKTHELLLHDDSIMQGLNGRILDDVALDTEFLLIMLRSDLQWHTYVHDPIVYIVYDRIMQLNPDVEVRARILVGVLMAHRMRFNYSLLGFVDEYLPSMVDTSNPPELFVDMLAILISEASLSEDRYSKHQSFLEYKGLPIGWITILSNMRYSSAIDPIFMQSLTNSETKYRL